ncbi:hypothetical protein P280DRAFT_531116 [Massarina eburnea CBS 473.64]|uniref:Peptidase S8/S53 domain-containing protein n=1 Tax=Massarina eburnea CBS 473.64 TaxID=1395130 RepID=A0A6A6RP41_9PLEO|nr:hypothetical protein P280DRAFT_531116 [Massarina eburnea CBS 473.64]
MSAIGFQKKDESFSKEIVGGERGDSGRVYSTIGEPAPSRMVEFDRRDSLGSSEVFNHSPFTFAFDKASHKDMEPTERNSQSDVWLYEYIKFMKSIDKHSSGTNQEPIRVAILDTGIDATHPAVKRKWHRQEFIDGGYRNFVPDGDQPTSPRDDHGHWTHCAGHFLFYAPRVQLYIACVTASNEYCRTNKDYAKNIAEHTRPEHFSCFPDFGEGDYRSSDASIVKGRVGKHKYISGTSMATPLAAALAATILAFARTHKLELLPGLDEPTLLERVLQAMGKREGEYLSINPWTGIISGRREHTTPLSARLHSYCKFQPLEPTFFSPTQAFIDQSIQNLAAAQTLNKKIVGNALYIIAGLKIAHGASYTRASSNTVSASAIARADTSTLTGVPFTAGLQVGVEKKGCEREVVGHCTDFVWAIRTRKIRLSFWDGRAKVEDVYGGDLHGVEGNNDFDFSGIGDSDEDEDDGEKEVEKGEIELSDLGL